MRPNASLVVTLFIVLALAPHAHARAGIDDRRVSESGPEDGILCCDGATGFLFDGEDALVTTGRAGIFRFDHREQRWQRAMDGLVAPDRVAPFVNDLCSAPSRPRIVYALAGLGIGRLFSSEDFGQTWTRRATFPFGFPAFFSSCAVDPDDPRTVYFVANDATFVGKLWKSTDGGKTVQLLVTGLPSPDDVSPLVRTAHGAVYVSISAPPEVAEESEQGLFVSTDGGVSFRRLPTPAGRVGNLQVSGDTGAVFVNVRDPLGEAVGQSFRSLDGGETFTLVTGLPDGFVDLAFDRSDPSRLYAALDLLYVSDDGGLSFTVLPASNDPRFLGGAFPVREIGVDSRGAVYVNTLAGPFRTDDRGHSFHSLIAGFRASSVQDLAFDADGELLVGVGHTQVVFRQDDGAEFRPLGTSLMFDGTATTDTAAIAASPTDPGLILVATNDFGLWRTDDGGTTWTSPTVAGNPGGWASSRAAFPTASRVYLASPAFLAHGLYRSDDAGRSFSLLSSLRFGALAVDPTDSDVLYVGTFGSSEGLFKTTDGGATLRSLGQGGQFSALLVDRRDSRVVYAGGRFGAVLRSLDGGRTFAPASVGLHGAGVHGLAQDAAGTLYVWMRLGGLFSSRDFGGSWHPEDVTESLERSGVEAGRGALVADPRQPGVLYLGNAGVIRVDAN